MMLQRFGFVGLAALSYTLMIMPGGVLAITTSTGECLPDLFADGDCDLANNAEECGFDEGDCCECTCVSTDAFTCGENGGFSCLDPNSDCVDDDDVTVNPKTEETCIYGFVADGDCDLSNNIAQCDFDGGDCCECTCVSTVGYACGDVGHGGFACVDPNARCSEDDDFKAPPDSKDQDQEGSFSFFFPCLEDFIGDGDCDAANNNEECDYDGGDCCECDCISGIFITCGDDIHGGFDCQDPDSLCIIDYVDAGAKTTVGVSANAYDTRPGQDSDDVGCMVDGCSPELARDGDSADIESRWSCARKIVPEGEGACEITFTFEEPQDIKHIQVSFWQKDIRSRNLEVTINGVDIGSFDSNPGSTFTAVGMDADNVSTLSFTPIGIDDDEWISLIEVLFLVEQ